MPTRAIAMPTRAIATALILTLALAPTARAELVLTYFAGTVTSAEVSGPPSTPAPVIHVGDPIVGSFSYDADAGTAGLGLQTPGFIAFVSGRIAPELPPPNTFFQGGPNGGRFEGSGFPTVSASYGGGVLTYDRDARIAIDLRASVFPTDRPVALAELPEPPTVIGLALAGLGLLASGAGRRKGRQGRGGGGAAAHEKNPGPPP